MSIYEISVTTIDGKEKKIADFKGSVLLIVNVASQCGFTDQYQGLEDLYKKYSENGLVVLGFPCNQFGNQEPGNEGQIQEFCQLRFGVSFPMFAKVLVNGPEAHPLYLFLKKQQKGILGTEGIKWNFTKFLVDRNGTVVGRYGPQVRPQSFEKDIQTLI